MKSRASLVLMEQLVMILVFALTAAICLRVFVRADQVSRETGLQDQAVIAAQDGAEALKACRGDLTAAADLLGGVTAGDTLTVHYSQIRLEITLTPGQTPGQTPGLGLAEVRAIGTETGNTLFSLTVAWQEVR